MLKRAARTRFGCRQRTGEVGALLVFAAVAWGCGGDGSTAFSDPGVSPDAGGDTSVEGVDAKAPDADAVEVNADSAASADGAKDVATDSVDAGCSAGLTQCADACVELQSDPDNCGTCSQACQSDEVCNAGVCAASCGPTLTDCNGACVSLDSSPVHCGSCYNECSLPTATPACTSGQCSIASCNSGFMDCNGEPMDGCEVSVATELANCGGCGKVCSLAHATAGCAAGQCTIADCAAGYADCNGGTSDGCEVSLLTDAVNCGVCGEACSLPNATAGCTSSQCTVASCDAGCADCNGNATDGCEVSTQTNPNNCGGCAKVCALPNATAGCSNGQCTIASCDAGYEDCDGTTANGCEVNLATDASSCGTCGKVCVANEVCSSGSCVAGCPAGQTKCGTSCVDINIDANNCGACSNACNLPNATAGCSAGKCVIASCNPGYAECNGLASDGCEVNTNTSVNNCGACSKVCYLPNATAACSAGKCVIASCSSEWGDCNAQAADGCETNLNANVYHCGACGRFCSGAAVASLSCSAGVCNSTCDLGFANCSMPPGSGPDDGCEIAVSTNDLSCGSCNNDCTLQGGSDGLVCDGGSRPKNVCGCDASDACRTSGSGGTCDTSTGRCSCSYLTCQPGEACRPQIGFDTCSCNGSASCGNGQVCCQSPAGCKSLSTDAASCGACGHACPPNFACGNAQCRCSNNASCNAGSAGTCSSNRCVCGSVTCGFGERCLPNGECG